MVSWQKQQGTSNYPTLAKLQTKYTPGAFDTLLITGRRMMPAFGQLNAAERNAIAGFVLNIKSDENKLFKDTGNKEDHRYFNLPYTMSGISKFVSKELSRDRPHGDLNAIDLNTGDMSGRFNGPGTWVPFFPAANSQKLWRFE